MKDVLLIGPSLEKTKGGMATVISSILNSNPNEHGYRITHLVSHVEGLATEKIGQAFRSISHILFKSNYDLVHIHVASGASFFRKSIFVLIALAKNKPVLLHIHSGRFDSFFSKSSLLSKKYIKHVIGKCDKVLVLSELWKEFIEHHMKVKSIGVLKNGVDTDQFKNCINTIKKFNCFIYIGRLTREKGIYDLLEAINIIVNNHHKKDLIFYIAGDGELQAVRELTNRYKLQDNVELLGWVSNKAKIECLMKGDTVILPSYFEGLPFSILEGMAAGKIIISTNVGSITDLVVNGENGFVINPGDINSLVDRVMFIASHPEIIEGFSKNNIDKVRSFYNISLFNNRMYDVYNELTNKKFYQ